MAEIVRSRTEVAVTSTIGAAPKTKTTEQIVVRSIISDRLDASVLRDLVKALDEAGVSGRARVSARKSDVGHLVELVVEETVEQAERAPEPNEPRSRSTPDPEMCPGRRQGSPGPGLHPKPHPGGTMTVYPPSVQADAKNRALRTFAQGLFIDVATVVIALLVTVFSAEIEWTREYWLGVAALVGKSALVAAVSYVARKVTPPQP